MPAKPPEKGWAVLHCYRGGAFGEVLSDLLVHPLSVNPLAVEPPRPVTNPAAR